MYLVVLVLLGWAGQSCVSYNSQLLLQEEDENKVDVETSKTLQERSAAPFVEPRIRPYDLLMIKINAFEGNTEQFLNREFTSSSTFSRNIPYDPSSIYFNSYLVDGDGTVSLPMLDDLKAEGLTVTEFKKKIDEAYEPYLKQVSTTVKLANLRVTVLGEVENPGLVYLYNEKTTILDAVSLAGDFSDFANRDKIKLVRQLDASGRTKTVVLNLRNPDFINTEYYYVRPDDLIYVEPQKAKAFDISARSFGIVLSTISVLAVVTGLIVR